MNFQQLRENIYKKFADGYVMVWNQRKSRYEFIRKAQEK